MNFTVVIVTSKSFELMLVLVTIYSFAHLISSSPPLYNGVACQTSATGERGRAHEQNEIAITARGELVSGNESTTSSGELNPATLAVMTKDLGQDLEETMSKEVSRMIKELSGQHAEDTTSIIRRTLDSDGLDNAPPPPPEPDDVASTDLVRQQQKQQVQEDKIRELMAANKAVGKDIRTRFELVGDNTGKLAQWSLGATANGFWAATSARLASANSYLGTKIRSLRTKMIGGKRIKPKLLKLIRWPSFANFKIRFRKNYPTIREELYRSMVFLKFQLSIGMQNIRHLMGLDSYLLGQTANADRTELEFVADVGNGHALEGEDDDKRTNHEKLVARMNELAKAGQTIDGKSIMSIRERHKKRRATGDDEYDDYDGDGVYNDSSGDKVQHARSKRSTNEKIIGDKGVEGDEDEDSDDEEDEEEEEEGEDEEEGEEGEEFMDDEELNETERDNLEYLNRLLRQVNGESSIFNGINTHNNNDDDENGEDGGEEGEEGEEGADGEHNEGSEHNEGGEHKEDGEDEKDEEDESPDDDDDEYPADLNQVDIDAVKKFLEERLKKNPPPMFEPDPIDLRDTECLVESENQLNCGYCYALVVSTMISYHECMRQRGSDIAPKHLSARFISDCGRHIEPPDPDGPRWLQGCNGGRMVKALEFAARVGMTHYYSYYNARDEAGFSKRIGSSAWDCVYPRPDDVTDPSQWPIEILKFDFVKRIKLARLDSVEDVNKHLLTVGPVLATIYLWPQFKDYRAGIYDKKMRDLLTQSSLHSVLIVGIDKDDKGRNYYIVWNSNGEQWGENGYLKITVDAFNYYKAVIYGTLMD